MERNKQPIQHRPTGHAPVPLGHGPSQAGWGCTKMSHTPGACVYVARRRDSAAELCNNGASRCGWGQSARPDLGAGEEVPERSKCPASMPDHLRSSCGANGTGATCRTLCRSSALEVVQRNWTEGHGLVVFTVRGGCCGDLWGEEEDEAGLTALTVGDHQDWFRPLVYDLTV